MKRRVVIGIILLTLCSIVVAESGSILAFYAKQDWFAMQSADEAAAQSGLTGREAEIYRDAYATGFYDALHPQYIEGVYMLNTKTKKFHLTNCPTTLLIDTPNRRYSTELPATLMLQGYKPCGQCHPEREETE